MPQPSPDQPQHPPTLPATSPRRPEAPDRPAHAGHTPTPRYYRARSTRRGFLLGGLAAVAGGGAAAAWFGTDLLRSREPARSGGVVGLADIDPPPPSPVEGAPPPDDTVRDWGFRTVGMVGDSITAGSLAELRYVFAAHGVTDARIDGEPSRRIEIGDGTGSPLSGIRTLYGLLADGLSPDAWVIALGTNDVGQYAEDDQYAALIDSMVEMLPADVPLVWVDVYRPQYLEATETFNRLVRRRLDRRDRSAVASWFDVASRPDQQVLTDDLVHPNRDGCAAFAGLVAAGLGSLA